jgi:lipopolysaccharide export LptBFGC system permease protein LptF
VVVSVLVALLTMYAQPWGQRMVRLAANDIIRRNVMSDVKSATFHNEVFGLMLYVEQVNPKAQPENQGSAWKNILIFDSRDDERPLLVTAARGTVDTGQFADALVFQLNQGTVHRTSSSDDYTLATFEKAQLRASMDETTHRKNQFQTARDEQSFAQLIQSIERAQRVGEDAHPMQVTLFARLGQLSMSLAFVLLGAPIALMRRLPKGIPFLVTLGGYLSFYLVARVSMQMADSHFVTPLVGGLIPMTAFFLCGAFMTYRVVSRGTA